MSLVLGPFIHCLAAAALQADRNTVKTTTLKSEWVDQFASEHNYNTSLASEVSKEVLISGKE